MEPKIPPKTELPASLTFITPWPTMLAIAFHWGVIALAIFLAVRFPGPATFLLCFVCVGTRQHALFVVMHEGTHGLIAKNRKVNDAISDLFAAWPVGISTERYRLRHWLHHRYLNSNKDPDWARKVGDPSWVIPNTHRGFWRSYLPYFYGKGLVETVYILRGFGVARKDYPKAIPFYLAVAALLTAAGGWGGFLLYWALPYATVNLMIHRFRYATEHMALPRSHILNSTRNIRCSGLENFLFSPMNGSMHLIHHLYPNIPWHQLRNAHAHLHQSKDFHEHAYEVDAYFSWKKRNVYREFTETQPTARDASQKNAA